MSPWILLGRICCSSIRGVATRSSPRGTPLLILGDLSLAGQLSRGQIEFELGFFLVEGEFLSLFIDLHPLQREVVFLQWLSQFL